MHVPLRNQRLIRSALPTSYGFVPVSQQGRERSSVNRSDSADAPCTGNAGVAGKSAFVTQFEFVGTTDTNPYLCVTAALDWRGSVGGGEAKIRDYCVWLARQGGDAAAAILGTEVLDNDEGTLRACAFANVRLPLVVGDDGNGGKGFTLPASEVARLGARLSRTLVQQHDTFIALFYHAGVIWARFSAQIYLELEDFQWAATVLRSLCERVRKGEFLE